jgi:hypothetical protein
MLAIFSRELDKISASHGWWNMEPSRCYDQVFVLCTRMHEFPQVLPLPGFADCQLLVCSKMSGRSDRGHSPQHDMHMISTLKDKPMHSLCRFIGT